MARSSVTSAHVIRGPRWEDELGFPNPAPQDVCAHLRL